jgi:hypothetical protein
MWDKGFNTPPCRSMVDIHMEVKSTIIVLQKFGRVGLLIPMPKSSKREFNGKP